MDKIKLIEAYREYFKKEIKWIMNHNGHNFEDAQMTLEDALDFALNDMRNEIYK